MPASRIFGGVFACHSVIRDMLDIVRGRTSARKNSHEMVHGHRNGASEYETGTVALLLIRYQA
ncbi:hypothetical protein [Paenibacillus sp. Leaf72]|uniref:hypothetical protein n=1 Tax=Paenibacillus sp. Leaf72 TaxID=1736234 RepID=UPI0012DE629C|nr:hypothetical protein [Paenibacillus sp. Leaf72]